MNPQLDLHSISILLFLTIISLFIKKVLKDRSNRLPLPPGPPKLPLIGNLLQLPTSREWETYHEWSRQYGSDIIQFDAAGTYVIVLTSAKAAEDLLEKRSRIYSDRPPAPMVCDLMGWNWNFGFMRYGDKWRNTRRVFMQAFHRTAAKQFQPQEILATHQLLRHLLNEPDKYTAHLRHFAAKIVMSVAYGLQIKEKDDPYVALAEEAMHPLLQALIPGAFLVDTIPILKHVPSWLPGASFKVKATEWKHLALRMINEPFLATKELVKSGDYTPSFVSKSLQRVEGKVDAEKEEERIQRAAGSMYLAGADTTVAAISIFILAIAKFPEAQKKAQEEIDRVLPSGRLPEFSDEEDLPYVTAVVRETLRWENVTPIGIAHYLNVEDEYKGYRIPAGSVIVGNTWSILHDERIYPDPLRFNPDRFMKDGKLDETVYNPTAAAFGHGRRVCPGRHMAYASVWLAIASILKVFHIGKALDENGNEIEPTYEPSNSIVATPSAFKCTIKPRSSAAEKLIRASSNDLA